MSKLVVLSWHAKRAYQTGGAQGRADLKAAGVTHIGVDWQDRSDYVEEMVRDGYKVVRTIGAHERPAAKDFSAPCFALAWDLEGGGDPAENARWFRTLFARVQARIPSCQIPIVYSGLPATSAAKYGCDYALLHREFRAWWGWPRPLPVCAVGGVRGVLSADALRGMPEACPVLHSIATPADWTALGVEQELCEQIRDRLTWVKKWPAGGGIMLVKSKDGPAGSRWLPEDSLLCRWLGEEIRNA